MCEGFRPGGDLLVYKNLVKLVVKDQILKNCDTN